MTKHQAPIHKNLICAVGAALLLVSGCTTMRDRHLRSVRDQTKDWLLRSPPINSTMGLPNNPHMMSVQASYAIADRIDVEGGMIQMLEHPEVGDPPIEDILYVLAWYGTERSVPAALTYLNAGCPDQDACRSYIVTLLDKQTSLTASTQVIKPLSELLRDPKIPVGLKMNIVRVLLKYHDVYIDCDLEKYFWPSEFRTTK